MSSQASFEHLCIQQSVGYSFDESGAYQPEDPENFEEVIVKLSSKIETSILLLETHKGKLQEFTIISIPLTPIDNVRNEAKQLLQLGERNLCVEETWKSMHTVGWDSLQVLAVMDDFSIPANGSRIHSLSTFITCILESMKAYFMFQKPKLSYSWSELFKSEKKLKGGFAIALVWKDNPTPKFTAPVQHIKRGRRSVVTPIAKRLRVEESLPERYTQSPFKREIEVEEEESSSEEEMEITFKDYKTIIKPNSPVRMPSAATSTRSRRVVGRSRRTIDSELPPLPAVEPMETDNQINSTLPDVTLGFEMNAATPSRKSGVRKSIVPDWPEDEKSLILALFDNLNPALSEQKRIVLTCKYVVIQYEKELTSKTLYCWIQKKGRKAERTIDSFQLSEDQQKTEMIDFFKSLNPTQPENTRIAFTLKYFQAQFNVNLPSKHLYAWLNDKPILKRKRGMK